VMVLQSEVQYRLPRPNIIHNFCTAEAEKNTKEPTSTTSDVFWPLQGISAVITVHIIVFIKHFDSVIEHVR